MKYAIIKDGKVENVIEAEQVFADSIGAILASNSAIGDLWNGTAFTAPDPAVVLVAARAAALVKIDAETDKVYGDVVGNKGEEYRSAEADAKAFIAANYTGTAGGGVTSWATAKGWTTTQAADDILAQATAWRNAQNAIRANRLARKEAARAAADLAALGAITAQWNGFLTAIRTQLGV